MANIIGQTLLNQYRVDEFIASGGMGAVYKVWDLKRNVPLAMKVLHADFVDDPSSFKYFQREARALQKLRHPHVVPFYGIYQDGQTAFLLEHYVDGPSLRDILQNYKNGLPISETLTYMQALCSALGYAHASGVVHCDIKPGNVMVDRGGQIYLADFGIARHAESTTTTIAGAGTPAYMSPEQIQAKPVVPATDVYSLGVLLFELLTGQRPFRGDEQGSQGKGDTSGERIRYAHLHLPPPDPRSLNPSIPPALAEIVLKCLAKKSEARYPFTGELLAALALLGIDSAPRVQVPLPQPASAPVHKTQTAALPQNKIPPKNILPIALTVLAACGVMGGLLAALIFFRTSPSVTAAPPISQPTPFLPADTPYIESTGYVLADTVAPPSAIPSELPSVTLLPTFTSEPPPTYTPVPPFSYYDLAFVSDMGSPRGYLRPFIVNSSNTSDYRYYENPSGYERAQWPSFCGDQLAVESLDLDGKNKQWIYLYDSSGTPYEWYKNKSADSLGVPRCSPNGKYMAYSVNAGGWKLSVADLTSGEIIYTPDSSAYGKIPGYASWLGSSTFIFQVSPDETYLVVNYFPSSPGLEYMGNLSKIGVYGAIAPDGSRVAFSCNEGKLCVFNFGDSSMTELIQTQYDVKVLDWLARVTPVWSADGQWIYYASVEGGDWDIFRIRPNGKDNQNITAGWVSNEFMPATR